MVSPLRGGGPYSEGRSAPLHTLHTLQGPFRQGFRSRLSSLPTPFLQVHPPRASNSTSTSKFSAPEGEG